MGPHLLCFPPRCNILNIINVTLKINKNSNYSMILFFYFHHLSHLGEGLPQLAYNQAETPYINQADQNNSSFQTILW
jgi:hypothetical protein